MHKDIVDQAVTLPVRTLAKTRLIFCTSPGLYSSLIFEELLKSEQLEIVGVFQSTRTRTRAGNFVTDTLRIIYSSGMSYAIYLAMGTLFFNLLRFPGIRPTVARLARQRGIPNVKGCDINSENHRSWIRKLNPDLLLSGFFNQKIAPELLSVPTKAALNIHPSILPARGGVDPLFYVHLMAETDMGVSLHLMSREFDEGKPLVQDRFVRDPARSILWNNAFLFIQGTRMLRRRIESDSPDSPIEDLPPASYESWPSPRQVRVVRRQLWHWKDYWRLIRTPAHAADWSLDDDD